MDKTDENYITVHEEVIIGSNGNPVNGKLLQNENGFVFKIQYDGLYEMLSALPYCSFEKLDGSSNLSG